MREVSPLPFVVTRIAEGFEFGHGSISGSEIDPDTLALMDEVIYDSPGILVPVEAEDDGCSDGRRVVRVFTRKATFKRSLHRPKVFGGAVAMATASRIGLGLARGQELSAVFESSVDALVEKGMSFGAHTAEHAQDEDAGCGAIDKAPEILLAILKYEDQIRSVITVLGIDPAGLDGVFGNFRQYVRDNLSHASKYSGRKVVGQVLAAGKVVKQLGGEHRERRIILNRVRGHTVNQELIRLVTGGKAQVFAADTWRMEDIAAGVYPNRPEEQHKAVLSELVYTIATGAVLTKGDLPIDMIEPASS